MTARPARAYRDPLASLVASERGTCKGCPHERTFEFQGSKQTICAIGRTHGERCNQYGLRQNHVKNTAVASDEMDEILIQWHEWSRSYQPALGYGRADSTCRDFKISNQWMDYRDLSEQVDHHLMRMTGEAVEPIIFKLTTNHRIAVMTAMRNFAAGSHVFTNPRSPATQDEDYAEAKALMKPLFISKGLLKTS